MAADLADDLPGQVEPEGVEQGLVEGELAGLAAVGAALARAGAGLPCVDDLVAVRQLVQVQLVLGLEGADGLVGWISAHSARTMVVFAGALAAGDDDGLAAPTAARRKEARTRSNSPGRRVRRG